MTDASVTPPQTKPAKKMSTESKVLAGILTTTFVLAAYFVSEPFAYKATLDGMDAWAQKTNPAIRPKRIAAAYHSIYPFEYSGNRMLRESMRHAIERDDPQALAVLVEDIQAQLASRFSGEDYENWKSLEMNEGIERAMVRGKMAALQFYEQKFPAEFANQASHFANEGTKADVLDLLIESSSLSVESKRYLLVDLAGVSENDREYKEKQALAEKLVAQGVKLEARDAFFGYTSKKTRMEWMLRHNFDIQGENFANFKKTAAYLLSAGEYARADDWDAFEILFNNGVRDQKTKDQLFQDLFWDHNWPVAAVMLEKGANPLSAGRDVFEKVIMDPKAKMPSELWQKLRPYLNTGRKPAGMTPG